MNPKTAVLWGCLSLGPLLATSHAEVALQIEHSVKVTFASATNKSYQVYSSADVGPEKQWLAQGQPAAGNGENITFFYHGSDAPKIFFKVEEADGGGGNPGLIAELQARLVRLERQANALRLFNFTPVSRPHEYENVPLVYGGGTNADLRNRDIRSTYLAGIDLSGVDLRGADLRLTDFRFSVLRGALLQGALFDGTRFAGVDLEHDFPAGADFGAPPNTLHGGADFRFTDLHGKTLKGFRFARANFHGANLSGTDFRGSDLGITIFWEAKLSQANLSGISLGGADFTGADLTGANFTGSNLAGKALEVTTLKLCKLTGASFVGADLTYVNLTGSVGFDGTGAIFNNTTMPDGTVRTDP